MVINYDCVCFQPDVADPLYAHCKAHIDKNLAKERVSHRKAWFIASTRHELYQWKSQEKCEPN